MRHTTLIIPLLCVAVLAGCDTGGYRSYTDTFPSGQKQEQGKRKFLGVVCGTPRYAYDGFFQSWYQDGKNESAIYYSSGHRHGVATNWFANGKLKYRVTWKTGQRDGPFVVGYDNGQVSSRGVFRQEVLESAEFFDRTGKTITLDEWCRVGDNRPFWR